MAKARSQSKTSDEAVQRATGFAWAHWFQVLDDFNVREKGHKAAAIHLHDVHRLSDWWSQGVVVRYEQERGLRVKHQKTDGFSVSGSRVIAAPLTDAYLAWTSTRHRKKWLPEELIIRKTNELKSLRILWPEGKTSVEVNFYAKGSDKSQVVVQHSKLANRKQAARFKEFWAASLDRLKEHLEKPKKR
jgi:hypothetical protein